MNHERRGDGAIDTASSAGPPVLPLTGERTVPGVPAENYWFRRHEAAYRFALPLVEDARALEVGCGEGYGTDLLATAARRVLGVDYDALTVRQARRAYPRAAFVRGNLAALPVGSATVDVLATLQVIEHVWNHLEFLAECRRVLRADGRLLVTTPNRLTFSPGLDKPVNPFHTREFTADELTELLTRGRFDVERVYGLHAGPRLVRLDRAHGGSFVNAQLAGPPDGWSVTLRGDVESIGADDFEIIDAAEREVDASLDLVVVVRPG